MTDARAIQTPSGSTSTNAATISALPEPLSDEMITKWGIDPTTYEVVGPPAHADRLAEMNTPDLIEQRRLSSLVLLNPDEYFRLYPKSAERIKAEQEAIFKVINPKTVAEMRARMTPERQATFDKTIELFLKGQSADTNTVILPPGVILTNGLPKTVSSGDSEN